LTEAYKNGLDCKKNIAHKEEVSILHTMIRSFYIVFSFFILCFHLTPVYSSGVENPVIYPDNESVITAPVLFFWQDHRNTAGSSAPMQFHLTIDSKSGTEHFEKKSPAVSMKGYFLLYWDSPLAIGDYHYSIDLPDKDRAQSSKFYGYRKYPVTGDFSVVAHDPLRISAEDFIARTEARHYNLLDNGYNALFYGSSAAILAGTAVLLLTVLDFNIYTRIAAYICGASGGIGLGAAAYYSFRYFSFDETKISFSLSPSGKDKSYAVAASIGF
jgi:hypothetical protein